MFLRFRDSDIFLVWEADVKERCQASKMCFGTGNISFVYIKREWLSWVLGQIGGTAYDFGNFQQPQICGLKGIMTNKNNCMRICSYGIFKSSLDSFLYASVRV